MRSAIVVAAALLFSIAVPAGAEAATYCVHAPVGCSGTAQPTVQDAVTAANGVAGTDAIQVGVAAMPAAGFTEQFDALDGNPVTITGVGGPILVATSNNASSIRDAGSTVSGITFKTNGAQGSAALRLFDGLATGITVATAGNPFATTGVLMYGGSLRSSQVTVTSNTTTVGVDAQGTASIVDTVIQGARTGVAAGGDITLDRVRIEDVTDGVVLSHIMNSLKTVTLSNSLIRLTGNGGIAMSSEGSSSGGSTKIDARGVTVIDDNASNTVGAKLSCIAVAGTSTITMRDTYLDDRLTTSLGRDNSGGGCNPSALIFDSITYSAFEPNGEAVTTQANNIVNTGLAAGFVDTAGRDYRLLPTSPLVNKGSLVAPAPGETDLAGGARFVGSARDIGAYEYAPPAPLSGGGGSTSGGSTPPPGGAAQNPPLAADTTKPSLTGLSFASAKFKAAKSGASTSAQAKVGTKVSFSLSEPSTVRFAAERKTSGRRVGSRCKAKTKANAKKRTCTRYVKVAGSFSVAGKGGRNTFTFRGRIGGKSLRPGMYRLSGQATDRARNKSAIRQKAFAIVR